MRRALLVFALAACRGEGAPAALLVDLAPGQAASNPTFVATGDDVYILTVDGVLYHRRGGGALEAMAAPGPGTVLRAALANGAFVEATGAQLSFCDATACTA